MPGAVQDVIKPANFGEDRLMGFSVAKGRIWFFFPLTCFVAFKTLSHYCASMWWGVRPHVSQTQTMKLIGSPTTELLQFLTECVTWPCDVDLWPVDLGVIVTRYNLIVQYLCQIRDDMTYRSSVMCGVGRSAGSSHFPHPSSLPLKPFPYLFPLQIIMLVTYKFVWPLVSQYVIPENK